MRKWYFVFLLIHNFSFTQVSGVVKDSISGVPIPYVNIWIENESTGTTSEKDGNFSINATADKKLVFSALGYERKILDISQTPIVKLNPVIFELDEVVIHKRTGKHALAIGNYKKKGLGQMYYGSDEQPLIMVKYFPGTTETRTHPFLKDITILTQNIIEEAKVKIRFYTVNADGSPGEDISEKNIVANIKKGRKDSKINLGNFNIAVPEQGFFAGIEWMIIEGNKHIIETYKMEGDIKKQFNAVVYMPLLGTIPSNEATSWRYVMGKWVQDGKLGNENGYNGKYGELAIKLTITD